MLTAFSIFWLLNVFYQVIATFFVYWIQIFESSYPALARELLWILFLFVALILWYKKFKPYWKQWRKPCIAFVVLVIFSVLLSRFENASRSNMFIWIKYWFWRIFILISASFLGYVISEKWQKSKLIQKLPQVLVIIVLAGFLWQWAKLLRPNFFYSLGYWWLNDYTQGEKPPIYYLTWYQWTLRWQGLFSWPNNYWYFLVAFLPFVRRFFTNKIKKNENRTLSILALVVWIAWMAATLSRAVLVWMVVVFVAIYRNKLKSKKRWLIRWWVWILAILAILSVIKRESTIWHITSKLSTIPEVISHPFWHGLGSSWPAVHYEWKYLPENYFLQIMLDIWTIWFLFRAFSILYLLLIQRKVSRFDKENLSNEEKYQLQVLYKLQIWFFALLVMWLFLHVFEDSMVNYLFFTIYGIILGSLTTRLKGELSRKEVLSEIKNCINIFYKYPLSFSFVKTWSNFFWWRGYQHKKRLSKRRAFFIFYYQSVPLVHQ